MKGLPCSQNSGNFYVKSEIQTFIAKVAQDCGKVEILQKVFVDSILNGVKDLEICEKIEETTTTPCNDQDLKDEIENLKNDLGTCDADKVECDQEKFSCETKNLELEDEIENCRNPSDGTCRFKQTEEGYTCSANKISIKSVGDQKVLWTGSHLSSKGNSGVESLLIKFQEIQLLPLEVGKTFNNLKSFIVDSSKLKKLKRNDFKTLENLLKLSLTGNEISSIESGTFDILTKLINLDLSGNQILNFPSEIFRKLTKLKFLNLSYNKIIQLRHDIIPPKSDIINFDAKFNEKLKTIEIFFVWNLESAEIIDFSSTPCNIKFDRSGSMNFVEFFNKILYDECKWKN